MSKYSLAVVALGLFPPAPLIRMSHAPNSLSTTALAARRLSFSRQFALTAIAFPPAALISSANFSAASRFMSRSATFAPHAAIAFAKSEQRTPPAPVTTAHFPVRSRLKGHFIIFLLKYLFLFLSRVSQTPSIYIMPSALS